MHTRFTCPHCGQAFSIQGVQRGQDLVCPSCHLQFRASKHREPKKSLSVFEKSAWACAAIVVVVAVGFLESLISSDSKAPDHQGMPQDVAEESPPPTNETASQPAAPTASTNGSKKVVLSDEFKGSMITGFAGYQEGMKWAANYGRVPTAAEYELIKLNFAPPNPASNMDQALFKAFLDGFEAGCKEGLQQRRPAF